ncbi:MAG: translocation/assembly module TamB domain-containing protein [Polyangiales bacterium]
MLRRVLRALFRVVASLALVAVSLVLHLGTDAGRLALRDALASLLPTLVPGKLVVGSIDRLSLEEIRLSRVSFADERGAPLVEGADVTVRPAWRLWGAIVHNEAFPEIRAHARVAYARAPYFTPTPPPTPGAAPGPPTVTRTLPSIRLTVDEVRGAIPGVPLSGRSVAVELGLVAGDALALDVRRLALTLDAMGLGDERIEGSARVLTGAPMRVTAALVVRGRELNCDLGASTDDGGRFEARLRACALSARGLDILAGRDAEHSASLAVTLDELSLRGPGGGPWDASLAAQINGQPVRVVGRLDERSQVLDVTVRHLSARRVSADAPETDLDGVIHLERHVEGDAQRFAIDTSRLVAAVNAVPVPPVTARATMRGTVVTIDELASRDIGLTAQGSVDVAGGQSSFRARVGLETSEVSRYPWVAGRASGAMLLHGEVVGQGSTITGTLRGSMQRLRVAGLRADSATLDATARLEGGHLDVDATLDTRRVVVPGALGPTDLTVHAQGDPRGVLRAHVNARGDGLLATLGPRAADAPSNSSISADLELDLSDAGHIRTRLTRSNLALRGVRARVTGDLATLRGAASGSMPSGRLSIASDGHGAITLDLSSRRAAVRIQRLDLAWLRPLIPNAPAVDGIADGSLNIDPRDLRTARISLRLEHGRIAPLGEVRGSVEVEPVGPMLHARAEVEVSRAAAGAQRPRVDATLQIEAPRAAGSADAWVAGTRAGHIAIENIDFAQWNDLLPPGVGVQGRANASIDLARATPSAPLSAELHVEGRNVTGGLKVVGRLVPAIVPLTLRVVGCSEIHGATLDGAASRLRFEIAPWHSADPEPQARPCGDNDSLLPRSLLAVDWGLRGPWFTSLRDALGELQRPGRQLEAATQRRLTETAVNLHVSVGPMLRAEWPLRAIPIRGADGTPRFLTPPELPNDAMFMASAETTGSALGLNAHAEATYRAGTLTQAGITEPVLLELMVDAHPTGRDTLLGDIVGTLNGNLQLSPSAPPEERAQIALSFEGHGNGARLLSGADQAGVIDRFEADTTNLKLERFEWARQRGVRGDLQLGVDVRDNARQGASAWARVDRFRARIGDADDARETPEVKFFSAVRLVPVEGSRWMLRSCAHAVATTPATTARATAAAASPAPDCDPLATSTPDTESSLFARAALPMVGDLPALRPAVREADVQLRARRFNLETLTPLVRDDNLAAIGGDLEATARWDGAHPEALFTDLTVSGGRAEVIALGEPMRDLAMHVRIENAHARIENLSAALGRGRMDLTGDVDLTGALSELGGAPPAATQAALRIEGEARQLPIGAEGNTYGWIDGAVHYQMDFGRDGASGGLTITRASVLLKEEQSRDLQPLSIDRDVFILGRSVLSSARSQTPYPIALTYDTEAPIWVRRSDLAVALRAHGEVRRERAGWGVAGVIEQSSNQCWFSVLGKRFDLDRTRVVFDGGVAINPQLDVAAHHDSTTLGRLTATVGGRLRAPSMVFGAANFPDATQAEILAMIALGRHESQGASGENDLGQQAGTQFASLITAMTMGTVNSGLSRTGAFLPTIILEPGQGASSGRYGAGVSLGPRFYLQATYGAASNALGQANTSTQVFRVLLEMAVSQAWSASVFGDVGRTEGGTQGSAGFDVFWSP